MSEFNAIEEKLGILNQEIDFFAKNLKFSTVFELKLSKITTDSLGKYKDELDFKGIYFFEINRSKKLIEAINWKQNFRDNWEADKINKSPLIASKRLNNYSEIKEWIPFYIGKSENIYNRIIQHFTLPITSSTSSLKLKLRTHFQEDIFRISVIQIETEYYDLVMHKIEQVLRNQYNPIVGKQ